MASPVQLAALAACYKAAQASGHVYPAAAACEGAVESAWFTSQLYVQANNIFGMKSHAGTSGPVLNMPTKEFLNGQWVTIIASWMKYPTLSASFADRMATLERLAPEYPFYAEALNATTPEDYLVQVSKTWSTDPGRAATCEAILHAHADIFV